MHHGLNICFGISKNYWFPYNYIYLQIDFNIFRNSSKQFQNIVALVFNIRTVRQPCNSSYPYTFIAEKQPIKLGTIQIFMYRHGKALPV